MAKLSFACLVSGGKFKWQELLTQQWRDEQIVIGVTSTVVDLGGMQNWPNCTVVSGNSSEIENMILAEITGDYFVWLNPQESIQANFLSDIRQWLEQVPSPSDKLLYGIGFVYRKDQLVFCPEVLPILSQPILVENILDNFGYFLPCIKYLWRTDLIKDWNLKYNCEVESWVLKQALFSIDYITSLYKVNGYSQVKTESSPLGFVTGFDPATPFLDIHILQEKITDKREIWLANSFSKVALKYRWMVFKNRNKAQI